MSLVTPDTGLLFWMVIIFGIVFFILAKFGFPVITKMVNERTESINKSLAMAEEARGELANLNKEQAELLLQAKKERDRIMDDAEAKMKLVFITTNLKKDEIINSISNLYVYVCVPSFPSNIDI